MKNLLIMTILLVSCSSTKESFNNVEKAWLTAVKNTFWSPQGLSFDDQGTKIYYSDNTTYQYVFSTTSVCGVYVSSIEFPPIEWYLYILESPSLIQYGPFLYSNEINKDPSKKVIFSPKE
ncbi:MAG: hypothetical protein ACRC0X_05915 [Brevinema sp.]